MKVVTIITGVLTTILGVYCVFRPGVAALSLAWMLGLVLVVAGLNITISYFSKKEGSGWDAFFGILSIIGGIVLFCNFYGRFFADAIIIYFIMAFVLISGILRVMGSWKMKGQKQPWVAGMVLGVLSILVAVIALFHPLMGAAMVGYMVAFTIITQGVNTLSLGFSMEK